MIEYKRIITTEEQRILENDLLDIKDWIDKAIEGKISNCLTRAARQFKQIAEQENAPTVPTNDKACFHHLTNRKDYKNRAEREQEQSYIKGA